MSKEEFENWLDIDNNADVVAKMTVSEICQANIYIKNQRDATWQYVY
jgi:hypothetical protein